MSEEGTYLIRSTTNLYGSIEATNEVEDGKLGQEAKDLYEQSQLIVEWAKSTREEINLDPKGVEYLPILLYALFEITKRRKIQGKTRDRVNRSRENTKSRLKLENVIVGYLDGGLEFFPSLLDTQQAGGLREDGGVHERLEAAERVSNVDQERPLGEVEDVLWRSWNFRGKTITYLLLPPYTVSPSLFLSHPLLVYSLSHTWNHGPHIVDPEVGLTRFQRTRKRLERYITPKRAHTLNFISYLFLVLLTLILALRPGRWLHPWKKQKKGPGTMETVYITWALSTWFNAFPNLSRTILLIPTACAPLMAYLDSESAFSILAFSIFPTILLLILPHSPSLVFTSREIIPLSTLLQHIIGKSLRTFGLVLPLVLILFAIFVYSLNGDIFRGFFHLGVSGEIPEKGIAPFETRLWLFVTFSFLFLLSLALATVRILTPIHPSANDSWEREYGPLVALYAREKWTRAVRDGIVSRDIIPPLNWIADSILPLDEVLFVYRFFPEKWKTRKIKYWMVKVTYCRDTIWIFVMGSLSFPLYIIDRLIGCV